MVKGETGTEIVLIPTNYRQATTCDDSDKWHKSMQDEYDSHIANQTWKLVAAKDVPPNKKIVGSTWSYDVKRHADGLSLIHI